MLSISVRSLTRTIIAVLAIGMILLLGQNAWTAWARLQEARMIGTVVDISSDLFTALHNIRIDRSNSNRALTDEAAAKEINPEIVLRRAAHMPAIANTLRLLKDLDAPSLRDQLGQLERLNAKLRDMDGKTRTAMMQPKAQRTSGIAEDYDQAMKDSLDLLNEMSEQATALIRLKDARVDQLLNIKHTAWVARNLVGDLSVFFSSLLNGRPLPAEPMAQHARFEARFDTSWKAVEATVAASRNKGDFEAVMQQAVKTGFGEPNFTEKRMKIMQRLATGDRSFMSVREWNDESVPRLSKIIDIADRAFALAKSHTATQYDSATRDLALAISLLALASLFAIGAIVMMTRRVITPLTIMQASMQQLASGDLAAEVHFATRHDEIGALGRAMQTFKDNMAENERLRAEQKELEAAGAASRKEQMNALADAFESTVGTIVGSVSQASHALEGAAGTLTKTADLTRKRADEVASASHVASSNVQSVAGATEELSSSVAEIGRQVEQSSRIAADAVLQAQQTDERVNQLLTASSRIGDVVRMITAIAEQTNLLALNATIEAARAGEAGKGFAVVAQEVKTLATQTAKATEGITNEIASMQTATKESVAAIQGIGQTINTLADIANAIAAAVEEQGATTREIAGNVAQAADGTSSVASNIGDVNRGAAETGSASSQVLHAAQGLSQESETLRAEVTRFVSMVRAA